VETIGYKMLICLSFYLKVFRNNAVFVTRLKVNKRFHNYNCTVTTSLPRQHG